MNDLYKNLSGYGYGDLDVDESESEDRSEEEIEREDVLLEILEILGLEPDSCPPCDISLDCLRVILGVLLDQK